MSSGLSTQVELKGLQTRRETLRVQLNQAIEDEKEAGRIVRDIRGRLASVEEQIRRLSEESAGVVVTEHALLRYVERVLGVDLEEIKKKILPPATEAAVKRFKGGTFPVEGTDFKVRAKNGAIVTILTDDEK